MIAFLDTCTILNLLQINYDDEYIIYLEKTFEEIKLTPIVFDELNKNKFINLVDVSNKETLDRIIFEKINIYVDHSDYKEALEFTKNCNNNHFKSNGESHSVSYAVSHSRLGRNELLENLLKTHFISDDSPAKKDFDYFYQINLIGKILDSIDLLTLFCLKGLIGKNKVIQYCQSLKQLYNKDVGILLALVKEYSQRYASEIDSKQKITITQLIETLTELKEDTADRLTDLLQNPNLKKILEKNKDWGNLLKNIIQSNFREKIPYINQRIEDLSKVWELDYN